MTREKSVQTTTGRPEAEGSETTPVEMPLTMLLMPEKCSVEVSWKHHVQTE